MNQATVLNTLADALHQFAAVAQTLKNNPRDIRRGLVEKRVHRVEGQISFCLCIGAITSSHRNQIGGEVSTLGIALDLLRKASHAQHYLCGKRQAVNDAHDEVDSYIRLLNKTVQELRRDAVGYTMSSAIAQTNNA